ncbi:unnamed protein product, partial [marine sediment metagenome]
MGITEKQLTEIIGRAVEEKVRENIKPYQDAMFEKLNEPKPNKMFATPTNGADTQDKAVYGYAKKAKDMFGEGVDNGFSSLGEILLAIKDNDSTKLQRLERDMQETVGETGGFLLPSQFSNEIIDMMLEEEICRKRCKIYSIAKNKGNTLTIPALSDYDHSSNIAGINTYWTGEGSAYTE